MLYRNAMRMRIRIGAMALAMVVALAGVHPVMAQQSSPGAKTLEKVEIEKGRAVFRADGEIEKYRFFHLGDPPRLVVDVYGVQPGFADRSYSIPGGFDQMRVGAYADKTRFVFDASGGDLPEHQVKPEGNALVVSWGDAAPARERTPVVSRKAPVPAPVTEPKVSVKEIDFKADEGKSVLRIDLSGPAEITDPVREGNMVRFGIKNARIDRPHRRTLETFAFPSAVRRITPYVVLEKGIQEVRFAAELKGNVPFNLSRAGDQVLFTVDNGEFAQPEPPAREDIAVSVPAKASALQPESPRQDVRQGTSPAAQPLKGQVPIEIARDNQYTGEKISLVFDDANIRNILQLIGEVSNLNIIAGEEVKGTITLRLIDVPWDQALELIMETKGLGMVRDGNVVRILPKEQIRAMRQAELTATREERQLEPLTTEVIPVSYSDLPSISAPAKELLTDRGKITADARNKQLIVTDIPAVVRDIKELIRILDTPERQVMIEARIVEANSNFSRDLGVRWGIGYTPDDSGAGDLSRVNIGLGGSFIIPPPTVGNVAGSAGLGSGLTFGRVGIDSTVLDLRISALENSGMGKVVSTPRVTTLNGGKALISQGTKIPYQTTSDQGTETKFENAELKLEVAPVINPDNSVILDIKASNSSVGATVPTGLGQAIAIDEKKAETKVLVRDGETTVIGGIFVEDERLSEAGVPFLMKVPILGHLFKSTTKTNERRELLVFITPRILN